MGTTYILTDFKGSNFILHGLSTSTKNSNTGCRKTVFKERLNSCHSSIFLFKKHRNKKDEKYQKEWEHCLENYQYLRRSYFIEFYLIKSRNEIYQYSGKIYEENYSNKVDFLLQIAQYCVVFRKSLKLR